VVQFLALVVGPALQAHDQDVHRADGGAVADVDALADLDDGGDLLMGVSRHHKQRRREQAGDRVAGLAGHHPYGVRREHESSCPFTPLVCTH